MSYEYNVFISYKRSNLWPGWVNGIFKELFTHYLDAEYGGPCSIFLDVDCIEEGMDWPMKLAEAHAKSKVLVPLLSKEYFSSDWCLAEIRMMKAREAKCQNNSNHPRLIIPASLHDGDSFPEEINRIQYRRLNDVVRFKMREGSRLAEKLEEEIIQWVPKIVEALNNAPEFDPSWCDLNSHEFENIYQKHNAGKQKLMRP